MAPLKWDVGEFGKSEKYGDFGECCEGKERCPTWDHTYQIKIVQTMDMEDSINKAHQLLADTTNMYKPIPKDPTNKFKNKLAQTLRNIKTQGGLSDSKYKRLYLTSAVAPNFYGLPKIHKSGTPHPHCL